MEYSSDEFTVAELLEYMKAAYGATIRQSEFTYQILDTWIRNKKVPDIYGGHKILKVVKTTHTRVLTIKDLDRSILDDLDVLREMCKKKPALPSQRPHKQRTALYFQLLGSKNQTKKTLEASTLPDNWKELGIKPTQLSRRASSKKKKI